MIWAGLGAGTRAPPQPALGPPRAEGSPLYSACLLSGPEGQPELYLSSAAAGPLERWVAAWAAARGVP